MGRRHFFSLIRSAATEWVNDNALRLSAALAYYSIFSLAPLLVIVIAAAGLIFGPAAARGEITDQMRRFAGDRTAAAIQALLLGVSGRTASTSATVAGLAVLFFGASGAFMELKDALNTIWGVEIKPGRAILTIIRERFFAFALVLGTGILLLVSLLISAALSAIEAFMRSSVALPVGIWRGVDIALTLVLVSLLFAMIFKMLPNVLLRWRDVWGGAVGTAVLFTIGKTVIGFYLGTSGIASYYGAAGSAMVILLWVYYSACILFLGAEFTKAYVRSGGSGIVPDSRAVFRAGRGPAGKKEA